MAAMPVRLAQTRYFAGNSQGTATRSASAAATVTRASGSGYSAMSARYVVLMTPHSRWITSVLPSDPFDDFFAEEAVGPHHQHDEHEQERDEVLGAAAHVGVDVAGGDAFHGPHGQAAQYGAADGVEAAQDHHREDLEAHEGEVRVHPEDVPPDQPARGGGHAGHRHGRAEGPRHGDTHGHGRLRVVGHGPQGDPDAAPLEEEREPADE